VYLADSGNHKIRRFTPEGVEDLTWGKLGDAEGDFSEPVGITTDAEGNVYVADNGNARLQIFDADGVFLDSFPVKGWQLKVYSEPNVAVTPEGVIWVTVPAEQAVRAYDRNGKQLEEHVGREPGEGFFHRAMGIVVDPKSGEIIVTDLEGAIVRLPRKAAQ
jgi:DNA-binding beta-propeller fold protein YncE